MKIIRIMVSVFTLTLLINCSGDNPPSFSSQANAGSDAYASNCATCHGANLEGSALGPILSGPAFVSTWGLRSPADFFNNIKSNMPPGGNENITDGERKMIDVIIRDGIASTFFSTASMLIQSGTTYANKLQLEKEKFEEQLDKVMNILGYSKDDTE